MPSEPSSGVNIYVSFTPPLVADSGRRTAYGVAEYGRNNFFSSDYW